MANLGQGSTSQPPKEEYPEVPMSCANGLIYSHQNRPIPRHMGRSGKRAEKQVNGKEEQGRQRREERKGDKEAAQEGVGLVVQVCILET